MAKKEQTTDKKKRKFEINIHNFFAAKYSSKTTKTAADSQRPGGNSIAQRKLEYILPHAALLVNVVFLLCLLNYSFISQRDIPLIPAIVNWAYIYHTLLAINIIGISAVPLRRLLTKLSTVISFI